MTISELIAALEQLKSDHGDLPVLHNDDWANFFVEHVCYNDGKYDGTISHPPHIVIEGDRRFYEEDGTVCGQPMPPEAVGK